ncbi:MAG: transposase [bacterium]|nr:transposase [bacterium]
MRKEDFTVGSYVHVVKRGTRGLPIVRDDTDRFRFLLMLTHFNDNFSSQNWHRDLYEAHVHHSFERPSHWPTQEPLVNIISFCLVENHFHLILQELAEGNIARFMQRLGTGMAKRFNERYGEKGSLFQGPYGAKTISDDIYFRYVSTYVQFKNALDMFPGGQNKAQKDFDRAYDWACSYPYSSLGDYIGLFDRPIVDKKFLTSLFTSNEYREFCEDFLLGRHSSDEITQAHKSGLFE